MLARKTYPIFLKFLSIILLLLPINLYASLIESTIGTAVVNDASATYHNPAALMLLKNPQMLGLSSLATYRSHFSGQYTSVPFGSILAGSSNVKTNYFLPSFYLGIPVNSQVTLGIGITYNDFYRNLDDGSLLRYIQSSNHVRNVDFIPAFGFKINELISLGFGLDISHINIILQPVLTFPILNLPDSISRDVASATSWGAHAGMLLKPSTDTLIGLNYRSRVTYHLAGSSTLPQMATIKSNNYHFNFWTPARSVITLSKRINTTIGLIGTLQYIQWSVFNTINIFNIVNSTGSSPSILPKVKVPYHYHNAWVYTVGAHYSVMPSWVVRAAITYLESPINPRFHIANGDSIILGASTGYDVNKTLSLDVGYSHAFIKSQAINLTTLRYRVIGESDGSRDAVSLKMTFNFV